MMDKLDNRIRYQQSRQHEKQSTKSKEQRKLTDNKEEKKDYPLVVISDDKKQKFFENLPYFNFAHAEEEHGFSFQDFAKNNFGEFLQKCYVEDFINMRKFYIMRNLRDVRFLVHRLKSPFTLICCETVRDSCEHLQNAIDRGAVCEIEDLYLKVLDTIGNFLNKLSELCRNLNLSLNDEWINKFIQFNKKCNELEDIRIKLAILPNTDSFFQYNKEHNLRLEAFSRDNCCTCISF